MPAANQAFLPSKRTTVRIAGHIRSRPSASRLAARRRSRLRSPRADIYRAALHGAGLQELAGGLCQAEALLEQGSKVATTFHDDDVLEGIAALDDFLDQLHDFLDLIVRFANHPRRQPGAMQPLHRYVKDVLDIVDRMTDCLEEGDLQRFRFGLHRGLSRMLLQFRAVLGDVVRLTVHYQRLREDGLLLN